MKLVNNTVLITGGTSGIGLELGRKLLKLGNKVILLGRSKARLKQVENEGFYVISCDLEMVKDIENAVARIKREFSDINILFNNAGIQHNYLFSKEIVSPGKIRKEISTNVTGQMILTNALIPILSNKEKAMIINTTSGLGAFPKGDGLVYSAGKAAMRNFTLGLRYALKKSPIQVLEFIPPVTDTPMTSEREEKKMPVGKLVGAMLPQIEKERQVITVPLMRIFLWISFLLPGLANRILSK